MIAIKAYKGWKMRPLYVKYTFLNGTVEGEVYIKGTLEFEIKC